ncbi:MAG: AI-2E family transporter [Alphaproteobacteria bacterium]|nr:MAG: AI-2E family transporter [Alphaproteobacteria bacterium]
MAQEFKSLNFAVSFIAVVLAGYVLAQGRELFVPFAIGVMVWYVINALTRQFQRIRIGTWSVPRWLGLTLSLLVLAGAINLMVDLISANVNQVARAAPTYAENLDRIIDDIFSWFDVPQAPTLAELIKDINVAPWIGTLAGALSGFAGKLGLVLVYVLFLLMSQGFFGQKLDALFPDEHRRRRMENMIQRMQGEIQSYLWIKTLVSVLTGLVSYAILATVGVDFASFWAFVIFLLNYIPTIGSIIGVVFPALLTLVQFDTPGPFLIVAVGLGAVQFMIGNILEPRLQGASLGLDPLVLIISLMAWGMLWGVAGMFLAVPITVIIMIVLSQFETGRPIAILMSKDGQIK